MGRLMFGSEYGWVFENALGRWPSVTAFPAAAGVVDFDRTVETAGGEEVAGGGEGYTVGIAVVSFMVFLNSVLTANGPDAHLHRYQRKPRPPRAPRNAPALCPRR
jgi:hypothetical protein